MSFASAPRTQLGIATLCLWAACSNEKKVELGNDLLGPCAAPVLQPQAQTLLLAMNASSPWQLPWKAYQDTWAAARMREAAGVRLPDEGPERVEALAPVLAAAGFGRVTFGVGWSAMDFDSPTQLSANARGSLQRKLMAAKAQRLRPALRLHGDGDDPVPVRHFAVRLTAPAVMGSRTVLLDAPSAQLVVPGRSGLDEGTRAAANLFMSVDANGLAQLSSPLAVDLAAAEHKASTLRFAPFFKPRLANGQPNAAFETTLAGYIGFAKAVTAFAEPIMGVDGFDIVLWGTGDSPAFLSADNYYSPSIDTGPGFAGEEGLREILARTAAALKAGRPGRFSVGDGFVDHTSMAAENAAKTPEGANAIVREARVARIRLPAEAGTITFPVVDALGNISSVKQADGTWVPTFTPTLDARFPEQPLTALLNSSYRPGQIYRDLSPIATDRGTQGKHGRGVLSQGGQPVDVWMDPVSVDLATLEFEALTSTQKQRLFAKTSMRALTAFVSKGASVVNIDPVQAGEFLLDPAAGPGGALEILTRFLMPFTGSDAGLPVWFTRVQSCAANAQFTGDGTAAHPDLLDRDVVFAAPFRVTPHRVVVAAYVMTYDIAADRGANQGEDARFDLPPERFVLNFASAGSDASTVRGYDPLNNAPVPTAVTQQKAGLLSIDVWLSDSPRLFTMRDCDFSPTFSQAVCHSFDFGLYPSTCTRSTRCQCDLECPDRLPGRERGQRTHRSPCRR